MICNFDLPYLPCHLHHPCIPCDKEDHEKDRVQYCPLYLLYAKFRTLFLLPSSVRMMLQKLFCWAHILSLLISNVTYITCASDLGYTNPSHLIAHSTRFVRWPVTFSTQLL